MRGLGGGRLKNKGSGRFRWKSGKGGIFREGLGSGMRGGDWAA